MQRHLSRLSAGTSGSGSTTLNTSLQRPGTSPAHEAAPNHTPAAPRGTVQPMKARDDLRTRHDEWVKRALSLWLGPLGDVVLDARIAGQSRRGDVLYTERRGRAAQRRKLGMLGELARGEVLFELYRNALGELDLKSCVVKLVELEAHQIWAARRAGGTSGSTWSTRCAAVLHARRALQLGHEARHLQANATSISR